MNLPKSTDDGSFRKNRNRSGKSKKKTNLSNYSNYVPRQLGFIQPRFVTNLRYSESITFTGILTTLVNYYVYRLNSVYDPNKTGTGHQPYGYDSLSSLYSRYRVLETEYIINCLSTNYSLMSVVPLHGTLTPSVIADFELTCEIPRSITVPLNIGANPREVKGKIKLNILTGVPLFEYMADDRYQSLTSTNPSEITDLVITNYNQGLVTSTWLFNVLLIYTVEFFEPINQSQSFTLKLKEKKPNSGETGGVKDNREKELI